MLYTPTTIDVSFCYKQGKSATAVIACGKLKVNRCTETYFFEIHGNINEFALTIDNRNVANQYRLAIY